MRTSSGGRAGHSERWKRTTNEGGQTPRKRPNPFSVLRATFTHLSSSLQRRAVDHPDYRSSVMSQKNDISFASTCDVDSPNLDQVSSTSHASDPSFCRRSLLLVLRPPSSLSPPCSLACRSFFPRRSHHFPLSYLLGSFLRVSLSLLWIFLLISPNSPAPGPLAYFRHEGVRAGGVREEGREASTPWTGK
ncbi:hypothetical protein BC826DRAFT_171589 [Russula brevipes]|nr:hypothetical protein BC826DRAFT_171589 [Russula brevipes]